MSHSRYVIHAVECDHALCFDSYEGLSGQPWPTVKQDARADGWTAADWRKNEGHRCPIHRLMQKAGPVDLQPGVTMWVATKAGETA